MNDTNNKTPRPAVSDKAKALGLILPVLLLCVGFIAGLCWFLRPATSETEKRELTEFPAFTVESFLSGEFTDQVSLWYADTFPGREGFIKAYHGIQSLFGLRGEQFQQGDMGDDIPDGPMDPNTPVDRPTNGGEGGEQVGGYYLVGDTAYELYKETPANSDRYAELITQAAEKLGSDVKVYDMILPLSSSVNLSESGLKKVGSSDAKAAIDKMFSKMSGITAVEVYDTLREHNDEYLYFRTDHHWTALGAYYSYVKFCEAAGLTPYSLNDWQEYQFEGFLGTLYAEAGSPAQLGDTPDTVHAWVPRGTNDIYITDKTGNRLRYRGGLVRTDTDTFYANAASKYNCFIMGDNPLSEIHNEKVTDGSSIVVVKESFGNALVPFLVDHYEYVYVVDYRYFTNTTGKSLQEFVAEKKVDTVLFVNNLTATSTSQRLYEIEKLLKD